MPVNCLFKYKKYGVYILSVLFWKSWYSITLKLHSIIFNCCKNMDLWGVRINTKHMPSLSSQHVQSLWRNCTELASWILSNLQSNVSFKIFPGYTVQYNESEWKKTTIKIQCWIFLMNRLIWWSHMENFNDISMSALVNFWRLKAAVLIHYNCMYQSIYDNIENFCDSQTVLEQHEGG